MIITVNLHGNIGEEAQATIMPQLEKALKNKKIRGVIIDINSGGGSASASELIYDAVKRFGAKKPVISIITGVAASGAYMVACGSRKIYSINTGIIGSVGVISMSPDLTGLMDKIGVKVNVVGMGKDKALMNPFQKSTEDDILKQGEILAEAYNFFIGIVKEKRHLTEEQAIEIGSSGIYAARKAMELNLVDRVDSYGAIIEMAKNDIGDHSEPMAVRRKLPFLLRLAMKFLGQ